MNIIKNGYTKILHCLLFSQERGNSLFNLNGSEAWKDM